MSTAVKWLLGTAFVAAAISQWFWFRMIRELNTVLPAARRIYWWQNRERFHEIKSLHEERFPTGRNRTVWFVLTVLSASLIVVDIALAIKPK